MPGSAPVGSCGQDVPRVSRAVLQTRVVLDAIVSNKTFGNATCVPNCLLRIPNFRACKFVLSFEFFGRNGCSLQKHICYSPKSPTERRIYSDAFRTRSGYILNGGHSFCFARYKFYLDAFAGRAPVVSWKYIRRSFCGGTYLKTVRPWTNRGRRQPAGAWSNW